MNPLKCHCNQNPARYISCTVSFGRKKSVNNKSNCLLLLRNTLTVDLVSYFFHTPMNMWTCSFIYTLTHIHTLFFCSFFISHTALYKIHIVFFSIFLNNKMQVETECYRNYSRRYIRRYFYLLSLNWNRRNTSTFNFIDEQNIGNAFMRRTGHRAFDRLIKKKKKKLSR